MAEKLMTPAKVASLRKVPGRHGDGGALYLEVRNPPAASWLCRVTVAGKRRDFGLGSVDSVSLADARAKRDAIRAQAAAGIDPKATRDAGKPVPTFAALAVQLHEAQRGEWSNAKHAAQWLATLRTYAFPLIGNMPVDEIDRDHILAVLEPIWLAKHETARRVRQRMAVVLDTAYARKLREAEAPMRAVSHGLPKRTAKPQHFKAMPYDEVAAFLARLRTRDGMGALALEFAIFTAARSGEVRGATWGEIDRATGVWTVPPERMKRTREHRVPLTPAALAVLDRAAALGTLNGGPLIFPGQARTRATPGAGATPKTLSDATLKAALRRMGESADVHGFRSSFRDWASEIGGYPTDIAEAALAHSIKNTTQAAYQRGDLLERRRAMMAAWAAWCEGTHNGVN